jgi:hypothetical protein
MGERPEPRHRPPPSRAARPPRTHAPALAALLAALLLLVTPRPTAAEQPGAPFGWLVISELDQLQAGEVALVGPEQRGFARPPPRTLDLHLLSDFEPALNLLQDLQPSGDTLFTATSPQVSGSWGARAAG